MDLHKDRLIFTVRLQDTLRITGSQRLTRRLWMFSFRTVNLLIFMYLFNVFLHEHRPQNLELKIVCGAFPRWDLK